MSSYSRQQLEAWLKTIDVKADSVLDIGGSQLPIKGRTKSWDVKDYKILDLKQPHEVKQQPDIIWDLNKGFPLEFKNTDLDSFNIAFCLEVSEYWYDPLRALKNINLLLKENGILYISFHNIYPIHNPKEQDYLRYTEFGVRKLLTEAGFKIEQLVYRKAEQDSIYNFYMNEKMRPAKEYQHHNDVGYLVKAITL